MQMIRTGYYGNVKPNSLLANRTVTQKQMTLPTSAARLEEQVHADTEITAMFKTQSNFIQVNS